MKEKNFHFPFLKRNFTSRIGNRKISFILLTSFLSVSAVTALVMGMGIYGMVMLKNRMDDLSNKRMVNMIHIFDAMSGISSMQTSICDAVVNYQNPEIVSSDRNIYAQGAQAFLKYRDLILAQAVADSGEWYHKLQQVNEEYSKDFTNQGDSVFDHLQKQELVSAAQMQQTAKPRGEDIYNTYSGYLNDCVQNAMEKSAADDRLAAVLFALLAVFSLLGISGSIFLGLKISKFISRPVARLSECALRFSQGKLDAEIGYRSGNEIGVLAAALEDAFSALRKIVKEISNLLIQISAGNLDQQIAEEYRGDFAPISEALSGILSGMNETFAMFRESGEKFGSGAEQVSDGAKLLAQGATEQAGAIEELSASIAEVSGKVKGNADDVKGLAASMQAAMEHIEQSGQRMDEMLSAMNEISDSSEEIRKIMKAIDSIAFQTNILALNAAVEAARAGNAGKGFAVVADEVRSLAGKSAQAAGQTAELIERAGRKIEEGSRIAELTANSLQQASGKIREIDGVIHKIESAAQAQSVSILQITQGVSQISAVVQTNSATAQESAAASEQLSGQALRLEKQLEGFILREEVSVK